MTDLGGAGFEVVDSGLAPAEIGHLRDAVSPVLAADPARGGVRNALSRVPELRPVIAGPLRALARARLGGNPIAVRVLLFDKTPTSNWKVAWHQDVSIAVRTKRETPGWGPWSRKEGVWHVRPPVEVLTGMLTLRLHLDPCGADNGPVRVLPGSHRLGRLADDAIGPVVTAGEPFECIAREGDVLVMRPLLLHASSPARVPRHRRLLHVEFAAGPLPGGLEWAERDGDQDLVEPVRREEP